MKHALTMILFGLLAGHAVAADKMTHEEMVVRTAYARLAYAVRQTTVGALALEANGAHPKPEDAAKTSAQRLADAELTFTLSNFVVGNLHDILDRKVPEFITPPHDQRLQLTLTEGMSYRGTSWNALHLEWAPAPAMTPEATAMTLGEALRDDWADLLPNLQHYVHYTITVTFKGRTLGPYQAMYFFGHDATGNEKATFLDPNTGNMALGQALALDLGPAAFTETNLRNHSVIKDWLNQSQMSDAVCSANRLPSASQIDICCDLAQMKCGPSSTAVTEQLSQPERRQQ